MKKTDFATYLNKYFTQYLPNDRGSTPQTIDSYRHTFILFLSFMDENKKIAADKIKLVDMSRENVIEFLNWLEEKRGNLASTRNQRQAAINGFIHYLKYEYPDYLNEYQKILNIPIKKGLERQISYLKEEGVQLLVDQIDLKTKYGLRDFIILLLFYTTGLRVSELIQIRARDLSLATPCTLLVHGKGQKSRYVPLLKTTIPHIKKYIEANRFDRPEKRDEYLFKNHMKQPLTRQGINYLIKKYGDKARRIDENQIPADLSPHKMRHTTAMALVSAGVDLIYIRDLLGHVSVTTTEVYAKADSMQKRQAIEAASKEIVPSEEAEWDSNSDLKEWLKNFNRR